MTQYLIDITTKQGADYLANRWVGARHATLPPFEKESLNRDSINAFLQNLGGKFKELTPAARYAIIGGAGGGGIGAISGLMRKDKKNWWRDMLTGALAGGGAGAGLGFAQQAWQGRNKKPGPDLDTNRDGNVTPEEQAAAAKRIPHGDPRWLDADGNTVIRQDGQYNPDPYAYSGFPGGDGGLTSKTQVKDFRDTLVKYRKDGYEPSKMLDAIASSGNEGALYMDTLARSIRTLASEEDPIEWRLAKDITKWTIALPYTGARGLAEIAQLSDGTANAIGALGASAVLGPLGVYSAGTGRELYNKNRNMAQGPGASANINPDRLKAIYDMNRGPKGGKKTKGHHAGLEQAFDEMKRNTAWDTKGSQSFGGQDFTVAQLTADPHLVHKEVMSALKGDVASQQRLYSELHDNPRGVIAKQFNNMLQQVKHLEGIDASSPNRLNLSVPDTDLSSTYARKQRLQLADIANTPSTTPRVFRSDYGQPGKKTRGTGDLTNWRARFKGNKGWGNIARLLGITTGAGLFGGGVYDTWHQDTLRDDEYKMFDKIPSMGGFNMPKYVIPEELP